MTRFEIEEKRLFDYFIDEKLLPTSENNEYVINGHGLELIVRPDCNQKCEYCYLTNHGHEMYTYGLSKEKILHNIDLILDYAYVQRKNFFREIQLFAGDLFFDNIFYDILNLIDKYFKIVKNVEDELFSQEVLIVIPSNLRFAYDHREDWDKIINLQKYFKEEYNARIMFSWSSDGLYCVDTREQTTLPEDYFDVVLEFCKATCSGTHPMISASNAKYWVENYDWWIDMFKKHSIFTDREFQPMILEVRNNDWDDESIEDYKKFLRHLMEKRLEMVGGDRSKLAIHLLSYDGTPEKSGLPKSENYDPLRFMETGVPGSRIESLPCGLQDMIHFNCTDLSLVSCHRLAYDNFKAVYFICNEDNTRIIDYKTHNISSYIDLKLIKSTNLPVCSSCEINTICMHGCLGSNYEVWGDPLLPPLSICKFYKAIRKELVRLYEEYELFDLYFEDGVIKYSEENRVMSVESIKAIEKIRAEIKNESR